MSNLGSPQMRGCLCTLEAMAVKIGNWLYRLTRCLGPTEMREGKRSGTVTFKGNEVTTDWIAGKTCHYPRPLILYQCNIVSDGPLFTFYFLCPRIDAAPLIWWGVIREAMTWLLQVYQHVATFIYPCYFQSESTVSMHKLGHLTSVRFVLFIKFARLSWSILKSISLQVTILR